MDIHRKFNMKEGMNPDSQKKEILKIIEKAGKVATTSEIAAALSVSWNTAEKYLLELTIENKVTRLKKAGVNLWVLK
jgi:Mn-dependent DtxR family transcriptional regulator